MALHYELTDKDFGFNASLDPMMALERMGFQPRSIYREGELIRVHCPVHKDLVRKSLIIDSAEKTFKCQYSRCQAHDGGLLVELVAYFYECQLSEVPSRLFSQSKVARDLVFRGEMFINQGRAQEAIPYFEQACSQSPHDEITRCKMAALYLELGMKDEAYQEYLRAAESYAVRGELEKTLAIYNILIMLQPGAVKARKQLAFLFSRLGRPDAAADQLKWVIDFYCNYGQLKGAIEACEQLLEADPESATARRILGRLCQQVDQRVRGVQEFEHAVRLFIDQGQREEALEALEEAIAVAPGNPRLREMREQAEAMPATDRHKPSVEETAAAEQAFHLWLAGVDEKLDIFEQPEDFEEPVLPPAEAVAALAPEAPSDSPDEPEPASEFAPAPPAPPDSLDEIDWEAPPAAAEPPPAALPEAERSAAADREPSAPALASGDLPLPAAIFAAAAQQPSRHPQTETVEILPDDVRVLQVLDEIKDMTHDQVEQMREQLISMFNDVRRSYEEGLVADWELRSIKEFYKAFNIAVDLHLHRPSDATPPPAP